MSTTRTKTPKTFLAGQYKLTASAVAIGSGTLTNGVIIKAKSTNRECFSWWINCYNDRWRNRQWVLPRSWQ